VKLWLAWIIAFIATAVLTVSLNTLFADTSLAEVDNPLLAWIVGGAFWLIGSFGTPLIAIIKAVDGGFG
jgi:hypothetical protein